MFIQLITATSFSNLPYRSQRGFPSSYGLCLMLLSHSHSDLHTIDTQRWGKLTEFIVKSTLHVLIDKRSQRRFDLCLQVYALQLKYLPKVPSFQIFFHFTCMISLWGLLYNAAVFLFVYLFCSFFSQKPGSTSSS